MQGQVFICSILPEKNLVPRITAFMLHFQKPFNSIERGLDSWEIWLALTNSSPL